MLFDNKKNEILTLAVTWMEMENCGVTAASQAQKVPCSCSQFTYHSYGEAEKWVSLRRREPRGGYGSQGKYEVGG